MSDSNNDSWKPNGRPQSTMAQSFSTALDSAFRIDNSLEGLARTVDQKKLAVSSQSADLEALEARLRATEERLRERQSRTSSPTRGTSRYISPQRQPPIGRTTSNQQNGSPAVTTNSPATGALSSTRPAIAGAKAS